jgi:hypothetical protein
MDEWMGGWVGGWIDSGSILRSLEIVLVLVLVLVLHHFFHSTTSGSASNAKLFNIITNSNTSNLCVFSLATMHRR